MVLVVFVLTNTLERHTVWTCKVEKSNYLWNGWIEWDEIWATNRRGFPVTCGKVWSETDDRFGDSSCFKVLKMGKVIWLQLLNQLTNFYQTWQLTLFGQDTSPHQKSRLRLGDCQSWPLKKQLTVAQISWFSSHLAHLGSKMNLDQKNYRLILSADISWCQLMMSQKFFWFKFIFLPKCTKCAVNQPIGTTVSWFSWGQLWQSRNLSLDFWWGDVSWQKSGSCQVWSKKVSWLNSCSQIIFPIFKTLKHELSPNLSSVSDQTLSQVTGKPLLFVAQISSHSIQPFQR